MAVAKKANPIAALKAGIFSPAAILHVLKSKPRDNLEIQHFGLWCWETFTGVRSQTTWDLLSKDFIIVPQTKTDAREFKAARIKNDPEGTGPVGN